MKVLVLGCGTSTGVPIPACNCAICCSSNPKNSRDRTSVLISTDANKNILVDTTPDFRHQALRFGLSRIDATLFTHAHADHIFGLDDLRGFNFRSGKRIPCYGTKNTLSEIRQRFNYIFDVGEDYKGGTLPKLELHEISNGHKFNAAGSVVLPFAVFHGNIEVTGYRFGDFAYATDCNLIPEESMRLLQDIKVLIIDGLRHDSHFTHFTITEAIAVSKKLKAKKTYLTHMCHSIDYDMVSATLPEQVFLAYDGLEIEI